MQSRFRLTTRIGETRSAIGLVFRRRDAFAVFGSIALGYLVAYLYAARDLSVRPDVSPGLLVVADPWEATLRRTGPASYDAIAILDTGIVRWLVSPINLTIGLVLAGLVGVSLALTYLAIVQPQSCGIGASSGFLASLPALLSGTVCCGPVILLAVGLQASGLLMTAFSWLLPVGVLLLVASTVYLAAKIDVHGSASAA